MANESDSDRDLHLLQMIVGESENNDDVHDQIISTDAMLAEELQLQEAIMAAHVSSLISSGINSNNDPSSTSTMHPVTMEQYFCQICMENKDPHEMFTVQNCSHSFCSDCTIQHAELKIRDKSSTVICPSFNCDGFLEIGYCRSVFPPELIAQWEETLTESTIISSQKYYCPYRDCSATLVNDSDEVITASECLECRRLFCAQCRVPWHSEKVCEEFQMLNVDEREREDLLLMEVALLNGWSRCPSCNYIVEKTHGCRHIVCRCEFEFCYKCGAEWNEGEGHNGCDFENESTILNL